VAFYLGRVGLPCPAAWARKIPAECTLVATRELVEAFDAVVVRLELPTRRAAERRAHFHLVAAHFLAIPLRRGVGFFLPPTVWTSEVFAKFRLVTTSILVKPTNDANLFLPNRSDI
jgi:hypothetical protein